MASSHAVPSSNVGDVAISYTAFTVVKRPFGIGLVPSEPEVEGRHGPRMVRNTTGLTQWWKKAMVRVCSQGSTIV